MAATDTLKTVIDTAKAVKEMVIEECAMACENIGRDWADVGDKQKANAAEYLAQHLRDMKS